MSDVPSLLDVAAEAAADVSVEIAENHKFIRQRSTDRQQRLNLLHVANAANHLERLPSEGETFHCVVKGNYPQWALVPAIIKLANAPIRRLYLVTLGFSKANAVELVELIDSGQIQNATALVSAYFKAQDSPIYDPIYTALTERNQRMLAMRTHAKIILALTDAHALSIEGSANLRSCRNIEQFTITNDRTLFDFHAGWIDGIFNARTTTNPDSHP